MAKESCPIEIYLRVGTLVVLHLDPDRASGQRFRTYIRGWRTESHILLDRPRSRSALIKLKKGQPCVIRFVSDGNACAFDSGIWDWDEHGLDSHCSVAWPEQIHVVSFRRHQRVKVALRCTLAYDGQVHGADMVDMSSGGCGINTHAPIKEGSTIELDFTLPDGLPIEDMKVIVRNVRDREEGVFLGCEFLDAAEHVQSDIAFFVSTTLDQQRASCEEKAPEERILLIDEDLERAKMIRRLLNERGLDVFIATATLDGLARVRALHPAAVVLYQNQDDLEGVRIARLLKMTKGIDHAPIFLYGEEDEGFRSRAVEDGATDYFPPPFNAMAIAEAVSAAAAKARKS